MAEYILKINARSKNARSHIDYLKKLDYVDIQDKETKEYTPNEETLEAMKELREDECKSYDSFDEMMKDILK